MPFAGRPYRALAIAVDPVWRSCTHTWVVWNDTKRPSSLIDGPDPPFVSSLTSVVVDVVRSRTKTSWALPLASPTTRSLADDANATTLPSPVIDGLPPSSSLRPLASPPAVSTLTLVVVP